MRTLATYMKLLNNISTFIRDRNDGCYRQLLIGHDKDYVITVRAVKKRKLLAVKEETKMWIDEME